MTQNRLSLEIVEGLKLDGARKDDIRMYANFSHHVSNTN